MIGLYGLPCVENDTVNPEAIVVVGQQPTPRFVAIKSFGSDANGGNSRGSLF